MKIIRPIARRFRNAPIRSKVHGIAMITAAAALLLTCAAFFGYEVLRYRSSLERELVSLGDVIGRTSTAALDFEDEASAKAILEAVAQDPRIIAAMLARPDGSPLTAYFRSGDLPKADLYTAQALGNRPRGWRVVVTRPVRLDDRLLGSIVLIGQLSEVRERALRYLTIIGFVLLVSLAIAYVLSVGLGRVVTRPLQRLARTAASISQSADYSLRGNAESSDEIGSLVESFNEMLGEIQNRDETLKAKNTELDRFVYTVSHDLKSPLVTILGFLGLMRQNVAAGRTERLDRDIGRVEDAARKMRQLVEDLLKLTRAGRSSGVLEAVPFGELACQAAELLAGPIAERGARVAIASDLPEVHGDRTQLQQVVQNLLANAVNYMGDQPSPRIEVGARRDGEDQVFYVGDNGLGIAPEDKEKVFELFERLDPGSSEGTGLGLALVKRIVEVHGGRIWVESRGVGHGSTFCFTLGRAAAPV